jgi:hypothetical protein
MKLRLWNKTKQSWVRDADSDTNAVCEFDMYSEAMECLERVNELKQLNPNNRDDVIEIRSHSEFEEKGKK